jgi:hypothetical protein
MEVNRKPKPAKGRTSKTKKAMRFRVPASDVFRDGKRERGGKTVFERLAKKR